MVDWLQSMIQTYEYYIVDPVTWKDTERIDTVKTCTINRDADAETLGSASFSIDNFSEEAYIRVYLITIQNGVTEKHPLGTFLVQTPKLNFNGSISSYDIDAYTPLIELKESNPPIGYSILKGENVMDNVYRITRENLRAPVVEPDDRTKLFSDFISSPDENWISFLYDLMGNAKYKYDLDEMGRVLFAPIQDITSLQYVWIYNDDNSSILCPEITVNKDLYGVPNVVEIVYSNGVSNLYSRIVNDDKSSPISTVNRGREIVHRVTDLQLGGIPTQKQLDEYAVKLLKSLSSIECKVTYSHGYCPVRLGDCVLLNYSRAGLNNVKAKVTSQSIKCVSGCTVNETAVFTSNLWR